MALEKEIWQHMRDLQQSDSQADSDTATQLDQQVFEAALEPLIASHDKEVRRDCQASLDHLAHETTKAFLNIHALQSVLQTLRVNYAGSLPADALALIDRGLARYYSRRACHESSISCLHCPEAAKQSRFFLPTGWL